MRPSGRRWKEGEETFQVPAGCFTRTTSVFVLLGILRYAVLAWRKGDVGRPERVLLTDKPLWFVLIGYAFTAVAVVAFKYLVVVESAGLPE